MIEQPVFTLTDDEGEAMTPAQAEARMVSMFLDPDQVERFLDRFMEVDRGLASLAVVVNPELRDKLWPTLDDQQKFWIVLYESGRWLLKSVKTPPTWNCLRHKANSGRCSGRGRTWRWSHRPPYCPCQRRWRRVTKPPATAATPQMSCSARFASTPVGETIGAHRLSRAARECLTCTTVV